MLRLGPSSKVEQSSVTGSAEIESRRSGGRRARAASDSGVAQLPFRQLRNPYRKVELLEPGQIEQLHQASLAILERTGIRFALPEALDVFDRAGAIVDRSSERVRIGREIVEAALATAPETLSLTPRNPAHAVRLGGDELVFATVLGPPYCSDLDRGRRPGTLADFCDLVRLGQYFNVIHLIGGSPVEPQDVPIPVRHLDSTLAMLELSDKVPYVFCHNRQRVHDVLDMVAMSRGLTREQLADTPSTYAIINTNSPLQYDTPMAMGVIELARHGQPTLITPFSLAGATQPVSLAGAMALSNAEMLAGLTLAQLVRPGAPVVTGAKTSPVDMSTGSPAFASPEFCKMIQIGGQLARRYRIPYRASNFNMSNAVDAQAAYESEASLWASISGGANLVMHAAGWLEGGLCASFEKFALDVELLQRIVTWLEPVPVDDASLALDEIDAVGPGGFYFDTPHTIEAFRSAFYRPLISTSRNYGAWAEAGAEDATRRAHKLYKQALAEYTQPPMQPDRRDALRAFVARRKEQGGAPLD